MPSISPHVFQSLIYSLFELIRKVSRQTLLEKSPPVSFDTLQQLNSSNQAFYLHLQIKNQTCISSSLVIITFERCKIFPVSNFDAIVIAHPVDEIMGMGYALQYMINVVDNLDKTILRGCRLQQGFLAQPLSFLSQFFTVCSTEAKNYPGFLNWAYDTNQLIERFRDWKDVDILASSKPFTYILEPEKTHYDAGFDFCYL